MRVGTSGRVRLGVWVAGALVLAGTAAAELPSYQLVGTFSLPPATARYDVLPDGRVLAISGTSILAQDAVGASSFSMLGSVPAGSVSAFGASFLSVSPSGGRIAIGDNDFGPGAEVLVFNTADLSIGGPVSGQTYAIDNYEAHWSDDSTLWISGGSFSDTIVTRLDVAAQTHGAVISGIGGASGGVTTNGTHLLTANGFAFGGPSGTGDIKAFPLAGLTPGAPVNFESSGSLVASVLSGNTLGFDGGGNLLVGGGPGGFAAVVDGLEVAAAIAGGPAATTRLALAPTASDTHYVRFNEATGELLVTTFGGSTVYRYAVVPAPGAGAVLALAIAGRRRRRG